MARYLERKWFKVSEAIIHPEWVVPSPEPCGDFKILTWNLLAPSLAKKSRYPYTSAEALCYQKRLKLMKQEFEHFNSDILLLQEMEHDEDLFLHLTSSGYEYVYQNHDKSVYGCMTLYKKSRFKREELIKFNLDDDKFSLSGKEEGMNQLSTKSIGMIVCLKDESANKYVILGNGHFYWQPYLELIRVRQWLFYMQNLHELKERWANAAVIIAGDFNTQPSSISFKLLTHAIEPRVSEMPELEMGYSFEEIPEHEKCLYRDSIDWVVTSKQQPTLEDILKEWRLIFSAFNLASAYSSYPREVKEGPDLPGPLFTSFNTRMITTDHILFDTNTFVSEAVLELPTKDQCSIQYGLPNDTYPSDHISLGSIMSYKV